MTEPEDDPPPDPATDPVHNYSAAHWTPVSTDAQGATVVRAASVGLMFHPLQNRGFLVRDMLHPKPDGSYFRQAIMTGDLEIPSHLVPLQRNAALELPLPSEAPRFNGEIPDLGQDLPPIPRAEELGGFATLTGQGGGQGGDDDEWPTVEIAAYLQRHHAVQEAAGLRERWTCNACYQRSKSQKFRDLTPEMTTAELHRVGPTRVESPSDATAFKFGMDLMARVHGLDPALYVVPIDIGQDDSTVPGRRGRRVADVMPLWARVVQMIKALRDHEERAPHELLSFVAMASHGWVDGTQLGLCMTPSHHDFAYLYSKLFLRELARRSTPDLVVIIYGCSAGGETNSFGSRSIGRWIANQLRVYGVANPRVDAHTEVAHAFKTPWVRRFQPTLAEGGGGGFWMVHPPGIDFSEQQRGELRQVRRLRNDRLREYRKRAQQCVNDAGRRAHPRRRRQTATFTEPNFTELEQLFAQANTLRARAIAPRADPVEADNAGRGAVTAYRAVIRRYHEICLEQHVTATNAMAEGMRLTDAYSDELPSADPPRPQAHDLTRWNRWKRAYRLVLDGVNFCSPLRTRSRQVRNAQALERTS